MDKPMTGITPARRKSRRALDVKIDLKDPDLYTQEECPFVFAQVRAEEPVYWNPETDSTGFWAITRYDDVVRVVQSPETFSASVENGGIRIFNAQEVAAQPRAHLLSMDPPQHTELRRALQPLFTPQRIAGMEENMRARLMGVIDKVAPAGGCEFVSEVAAPLALGVLTDLLDTPAEDGAQLLKWSDAFVGDDDDNYQPSMEYRQRCVREMDEYALRLRSEREGRGGDDFAALLARATVDGRRIDDDTYTTNFGAFLIAGNESTRHALANGIVALSLFPSEKARLVADPSLIGSAVKEIVRWATPLMHVRRTAMHDVELGGKEIKKGDKVVVWYNSANRDELKWASAMQFDVCRFADRSAAPHVGFGHGPHYCQGWRLAELQLRVALEALLKRLPDIRMSGPATRLRSNFIGGIKRLPVVFTPEASAAGGAGK